MTATLRNALADEFTSLDRRALFRDTPLSPSSLAAWAIDRTPLPTAPRKERFRTGDEHRLNDERFALFNAIRGRSEVIEFVASYVRDFIPAPAITEDDHWVATVCPQAGVLSRINIGPVHVALVGECIENGQHPVRLWVAESPLVAMEDDEDLTDILNDLAIYEGVGATQPGGGEDQVSFRIDTIPVTRRFLAVPAVARAARLYNARQAMRRTSWHSAHVPALADRAFVGSRLAPTGRRRNTASTSSRWSGSGPAAMN